MYISFHLIAPILHRYFADEKPQSVLIISADARKYGALIRNAVEDGRETMRIDRIDISEPHRAVFRIFCKGTSVRKSVITRFSGPEVEHSHRRKAVRP